MTIRFNLIANKPATYEHFPSSIGIGFLGLVYNFGGASERPGMRGISHLMEHLMCKPFDDMRTQLRCAGIEHNAYTADNRTVFYFEGLEENLKTFSQELVDRITLQANLWTPEAFEQEKRTVLQEYGDCFNDQVKGSFYNSMRKHFGYAGPIGVRQDIEAFTFEDSIRLAARYREPFKICEVSSKPELNLNEIHSASAPAMDHYIQASFSEDSGLACESLPKQDKTLVGLISNKLASNDLYAKMDFIVNCLTAGLESPLYQEIREKRGLSYFSSGWVNEIGNQFALSFFASTSNKQAKDLKEVYAEFFSKPLSSHISKDRFTACYSELMNAKKRCELLPFEGVKVTALRYNNPFQDMERLTYEQALEIGEAHLSLSNFCSIEY